MLKRRLQGDKSGKGTQILHEKEMWQLLTDQFGSILSTCLVTGTCQKLIAFFKTETGRILEWLWDQPHGGQFSAARAWPGAPRLDQGTWQPNHLAKEPGTCSAGSAPSAGMLRGRINPVALLTSHGGCKALWHHAGHQAARIWDVILYWCTLSLLHWQLRAWLGTKGILKSSYSTGLFVDLNMCLKKWQHYCFGPWGTEEFSNSKH